MVGFIEKAVSQSGTNQDTEETVDAIPEQAPGCAALRNKEPHSQG